MRSVGSMLDTNSVMLLRRCSNLECVVTVRCAIQMLPGTLMDFSVGEWTRCPAISTVKDDLWCIALCVGIVCIHL